ncbi:hypothetical protein B484DRAFT_455911 [Ochromonadaceae sp. CCMP2298]|nr:hypothetical protein B484DRAFT_455911 [Ochromonadaceae sp. CCMP2298]
MASRAAAASYVEASLSSLSSDLLMRVANWLSVTELCVFDKATASNKQLWNKYLFSLRNDTFLYPGADVDYTKSSEWQQGYARWVTMRHVFVNSITLNEQTTPSVLLLYDTMNGVNPGLVSLTLHGDVTFPKDIAVRSAHTLHTLVIIHKFGSEVGPESMRKLMGSVREWGSMGGTLQKLMLKECKFGNEAVDFGGSDALTYLHIWDCTSDQSTTPGDSFGYTHLLWGILHKCANLKTFTYANSAAGTVARTDRDLCLLARFCLNLTHLLVHSDDSMFSEAALGCVAMKCSKLEELELFTSNESTDSTIQTIAANLASLKSLAIWSLQLRYPRTLRYLAHGCPQLEDLRIYKGNDRVTEAELQHLVVHAKRLQRLEIIKWEHLDFRERWGEIQPYEYDAEKLLQLGMEDPEAFLSSQQDRFQVLSAATQQPGEIDDTDTEDKLKAASSNPHFKLVLE